MATEFPRLAILRELDELLSGICEHRFITTRPSATGQQMDEFLLLRLPQQIRTPGDTYQLTTGQVAIFVRDLQGGLENTCRLEEIQQSITRLLPIRDNKFFAHSPILLGSASDSAGFHYLIIQFSIRIHKDFDIHQNDLTPNTL